MARPEEWIWALRAIDKDSYLVLKTIEPYIVWFMQRLSRLVVALLTFWLSGCVFPYHSSYFAPKPILIEGWNSQISRISGEYPDNSRIRLFHPDGINVILYTPPYHNDGKSQVKLKVKITFDTESGSINFLDSRLSLLPTNKVVTASEITEVRETFTPKQLCLWGYCRGDGFARKAENIKIEGPVSIRNDNFGETRIYTNYILDFEVSGEKIQTFAFDLSAISFLGKKYDLPGIEFKYTQGWGVAGIP
ncbi:MAG: hypothetical protein OEY09_17970 [Gammaproteobacteria bacterium]|nr:hypothetical protein [Gammaproteobacteria bacterium]